MPYIEDTLQLKKVIQFLAQYNPSYVIVEKEGPRPGQSAQSMWRFSKEYGQLLGALEVATNYPVILIPPVEWAMCLDALYVSLKPSVSSHHEPENAKGKHSTKQRFREIALALYPDLPPLLSKKSMKSIRFHEGLVDAVLIGFYYLYRNGYIARWRVKS
jgi:hypothetical protein